MSGSNRGNNSRLPFSNILRTSVLINQRCRLVKIISKCVSTHGVCGCRPTLPSALAYTRTHTLSHSLSLRVSVFFLFHIKTYLLQLSSIIEIQDSIVFGCSHFIKVALIRNECHYVIEYTIECHYAECHGSEKWRQKMFYKVAQISETRPSS